MPYRISALAASSRQRRFISAAALHGSVPEGLNDAPVGGCVVVHVAARVFPIEVIFDVRGVAVWPPASGEALLQHAFQQLPAALPAL